MMKSLPGEIPPRPPPALPWPTAEVATSSRTPRKPASFCQRPSSGPACADWLPDDVQSAAWTGGSARIPWSSTMWTTATSSRAGSMGGNGLSRLSNRMQDPLESVTGALNSKFLQVQVGMSMSSDVCRSRPSTVVTPSQAVVPVIVTTPPWLPGATSSCVSSRVSSAPWLMSATHWTKSCPSAVPKQEPLESSRMKLMFWLLPLRINRIWLSSGCP